MLGTQELRWLTNPNSDLVFHYTSYAILQKILSSGRIRFGSMSRSNDIYERLFNGIEPSVWDNTKNEAYGSIKAAVLIQNKLHKRSKTFSLLRQCQFPSLRSRLYELHLMVALRKLQ